MMIQQILLLIQNQMVDNFVNGDLDAVKQTIQDVVVKTVSDVVNGTSEELPVDPVDPVLEPKPEE